MPRLARPAAVSARPTRHSGAVASAALVFNTAYERRYEEYLADRAQDLARNVNHEQHVVQTLDRAPPAPAPVTDDGAAPPLHLAPAARDGELRASDTVVLLDAKIAAPAEVPGTNPASEEEASAADDADEEYEDEEDEGEEDEGDEPDEEDEDDDDEDEGEEDEAEEPEEWAANIAADTKPIAKPAATKVVVQPAAVPLGTEKPQLVLYSATAKLAKRPVLQIYDAMNDKDNLSSRVVKRCKWTDHAPASLKGREFTPNQAVCALRDALHPGSGLGNSGVNMKVALCINAEGQPVLLKTVIAHKALASYITAE